MKQLTDDEITTLAALKKMNEKIIEKVEAWQSFPYVKPLVCKREGCGECLVAIEKRRKVVLQCPKCKNVQPYVPRAILEANMFTSSPNLERNKTKYQHHYDGSDSTSKPTKE